MSISFSQQCKAELLVDEAVQGEFWLAGVLTASASFRLSEISFKSLNAEVTSRFIGLAKHFWQLAPVLEANGKQMSVFFRGEEACGRVRERLQALLDFNTVRGSVGFLPEQIEEDDGLDFLRAVFLQTASVANPARGYQVEFAIKRAGVQALTRGLLERLGLETLIIPHGAYNWLYIKNGDDIADFLAYIGAHQSYLRFEETRVRKTVNEQINRAVNCDNANTQRVADTSARQIDIIRRLEAQGGFVLLSEDLAKVARLRLEYPGYSIRELGECLDPPLGKSGMYHRLGRLESFARQYLAESVSEEE